MTGRPCKNHPSRRAKWKCCHCHNYFCDGCDKHQDIKKVQFEECPLCRGLLKPLKTASGHHFHPKSFLERLSTAFAYPFTKGGAVLLLVGAVSFALMWHLHAQRSALLAIAGLTCAYVAATLLKITNFSAQDHHDFPPWPSVARFWNDLLVPTVLLAATFAIAFAPYAFFRFAVKLDPMEHPHLLRGLVIAGLLYLPMGAAAAAIRADLKALNPLMVTAAILKTLPQYVPTCILLLALVMLRIDQRVWDGLFAGKDLLSPLFDGALCVYGLMVVARLLGLTYLANWKRFDWTHF